MRKVLRAAIPPIIIAVFSMVFALLSSTTFFDNWLREIISAPNMEQMDFQFDHVKSFINVANQLLLVLPLSIQAIWRGVKANKTAELMKRYGASKREDLFYVLKDKGYIVGGSPDDFNIRVFKRSGNHLISNDIDGFCGKPINRKLSFSLRKQEGLCTQAFQKRRSMLEPEDAAKPEYHLNHQQLVSAGSLKFIVAIPISNANGGAEKYVICFDSFQQITKPGSEEAITKLCENYAYEIYDMIN